MFLFENHQESETLSCGTILRGVFLKAAVDEPLLLVSSLEDVSQGLVELYKVPFKCILDKDCPVFVNVFDSDKPMDHLGGLTLDEGHYEVLEWLCEVHLQHAYL